MNNNSHFTGQINIQFQHVTGNDKERLTFYPLICINNGWLDMKGYIQDEIFVILFIEHMIHKRFIHLKSFPANQTIV